MHKAPVKLVPTIFVTEVESSSQRFGIMYFKISFTNNSSLLAKIVGVECSFDAKYCFCPSLVLAKDATDVIWLDRPVELPLSIPPHEDAELAFCCAGVPTGANFEIRAKTLNKYDPSYILIIT